MNRVRINWAAVLVYALALIVWCCLVVAVVTSSPDWQIIGFAAIAGALAWVAGAIAGGSNVKS